MEFYAYHGVYPGERKKGNWFRVDLSFSQNIAKAGISDSLTDTVDYVQVFRMIEEEMKIPSNLLEHLATRLMNRLHEQFPELKNIELKITKKSPPVDGNIAGVSISVSQV